MSKTIRTICALLAIVIISAGVGMFAEHIKNKYELTTHPKEFSEFVEKYANEYKVPEKICYSVIKCESGFNSAAKSHSGAIGLMQIMPDTFEYLCTLVGENYETGMLYDPETNIRFGTYYLSILYERFGIWETAFAAYNAGPSRVDGWIKEGKADDFGRLTEIPIEETATYVERITNSIEKYEKLYYQ